MHPTTHTRPINEHSTTCTISHTYTAVLNTHNIHTYTLLKNHMLTHNPTTYINPPYSPHDSHMHMNSPLHSYSSHTHAYAPTQHCIHSPLFTHTPPHKRQRAHIYTPSTHVHTHTAYATLYIHPPLHTLLLHYPHPPYPHSHTPSHTCTQTHKLTHTSCTPPYSKMLMTTLSTPLSLISRSVLPTCPSCICHHSLLRSLSSARLITFLLWRL